MLMSKEISSQHSLESSITVWSNQLYGKGNAVLINCSRDLWNNNKFKYVCTLNIE